MEKILIEVDGIIHTFESIKEAAKYKVEFLEQMELSLDESSDQRICKYNLIKNKFVNNPNKFLGQTCKRLFYCRYRRAFNRFMCSGG